MSKNLYVIAGCNGAGKTTASLTILPEILMCKEFLNADEIARGLSPFQPEKVAFEAGRLMLKRFDFLIRTNDSFAVETTLATKIYRTKIEIAKSKGYNVVLLFFWLRTVDLAFERVKIRVEEGGHNIPPDALRRRYYSGMKNLFEIYLPLVNEAIIFDNSDGHYEIISEKNLKLGFTIYNEEKFNNLKNYGIL